jgi:hypothetical protein
MDESDMEDDEDEDEEEGQEGQKVLNRAAALSDLRKWRAKSKKRGTLAPFESDAIPADMMTTIKTHSANGWLEALDDAIGKVEPLPAPDVSALVVALTKATDALLRPAQPVDE